MTKQEQYKKLKLQLENLTGKKVQLVTEASDAYLLSTHLNNETERLINQGLDMLERGILSYKKVFEAMDEESSLFKEVKRDFETYEGSVRDTQKYVEKALKKLKNLKEGTSRKRVNESTLEIKGDKQHKAHFEKLGKELQKAAYVNKVGLVKVQISEVQSSWWIQLFFDTPQNMEELLKDEDFANEVSKITKVPVRKFATVKQSWVIKL